MKILFALTRADEWGGAQVHVYDLACALMHAGHEVVIAAGAAGRAASKFQSVGLRFVRLRWLKRSIRPFEDLMAIFELRRLMKRVQPDIVALHSSKAGLIGRVACRWAKVPAVFTVHGWAFSEGVGKNRQRLYKTLERWATPLAAHVITVSEYDKRLAVQSGVGLESDFTVVHNGIPDMTPRPAPRLLGGRVRLIMVGRFSAPKSQEQLIKALAQGKGRDWQLQLVGEGERKQRCERLTQSLGLSRCVAFAGQVDDVAERLDQSDIFVLATNWEGLPISIIEAMRAALPIVASEVGGVSELVQNGENGYLVPRGNTNALAERLAALIGNSELRQRMGAASRVRFEKYFTFQRMYEQTCSIYTQIILNNRRTVR